jgi:hypothetical protein
MPLSLGDFSTGQTVDFTFTSVSSGAPTALTGGVVDILKDNTTSESTEGVTLTSTFRTVVGNNHVRVVMTNAFYAAGSKYSAILSAGTVGGTTVAGYTLANWSIRYGTIDNVADGTTTLSTDVDDLITSTTAIYAESTASAAVIDLIGAETSGLTTDLEQLTSSSSRLEASTTSIQAGTTGLTTANIATAVWDETITELTTAMPATPTVLDILAFQHMAAYNKHATTASSGVDLSSGPGTRRSNGVQHPEQVPCHTAVLGPARRVPSRAGWHV